MQLVQNELMQERERLVSERERSQKLQGEVDRLDAVLKADRTQVCFKNPWHRTSTWLITSILYESSLW